MYYIVVHLIELDGTIPVHNAGAMVVVDGSTFEILVSLRSPDREQRRGEIANLFAPCSQEFVIHIHSDFVNRLSPLFGPIELLYAQWKFGSSLSILVYSRLGYRLEKLMVENSIY